jgi:hypothetical protein
MNRSIYGSAALIVATLACCGCKERRTPVNEIVNREASIPKTTLPMNPLGWRVVSSFADRNDHTMATLYGNNAAVNYIRATSGSAYPAGSVLSLVTWRQKEDKHWFGGSIPAAPITVEFVQAQPDAHGSPQWTYSRYEGSPLHPVATSVQDARDRIQRLTNEHAAPMP